MLQARQLGKELYVGVHSDADILHNKGPVVMRLDERLTAVNACKWLTEAVPGAPYVTDPSFMAKYGCKYVVHGDDITTDANGEDCYKGVKEKGMFVVVKRTPNILTTDLVGRMLLMSKTHHFAPISDLKLVFSHPLFAEEGAVERFHNYASDSTGRHSGSGVYVDCGGEDPLVTIVEPSKDNKTKFEGPIVYVDGGFDLFHPGHIEALRLVRENAAKTGAAVFVGLHDDKVVNKQKGLNYPIMTAGVYDEVAPLFAQLPKHKYTDINTEVIVARVLSNKKAYEERQARKGWKAAVERELEAEEKQK
ncbi:hypothetical protein HF325_000107 [Metschnikowia pulcherrima]|uniref:ethanolamine-phosphate cytidylyltransferase n=1 Tax=Metschnikowia pulcherrima TaxID=27326 RepID=A0A8H7LEH2_9ASCO|nr:hypothetical protein HF325_000107 [Metschnikowia pulcherrima]